MMDKEHADFDAIYQQIKDAAHDARSSRSRSRSAQGADFHGIVNLFTKKAHIYKRGHQDRRVRGDRHPRRGAGDQFDRYYQELIETIAATDDSLLERYLEGGEIGRDEAIHGDEGSDEAHGAVPALLRLRRAQHTASQALLTDDRAS